MPCYCESKGQFTLYNTSVDSVAIDLVVLRRRCRRRRRVFSALCGYRPPSINQARVAPAEARLVAAAISRLTGDFARRSPADSGPVPVALILGRF